MTIAKLNEQHDYITLKVVFDSKTSVNLTQSRRGLKVSGKGEVTNSQLQSLLTGFDKYGKEQKLTHGPKMHALRAMATQCTTLSELIEKLGGPKAKSKTEELQEAALKALMALAINRKLDVQAARAVAEDHLAKFSNRI